ncbi:MAG: prepilin-type N-terminal cleavage/methylation domain-containing protein [Bacilli bacterium]|nr:prepilin-type N-terminal cleavage/methylation domain-containing protein [Bacilli bacterium]MDD4608091.1 prepilin-type N-terminal cleavage/methylation domain-containing protein [Bacilli bacterium]
MKINKKGFTLIELLGVLILISLLAILVTPSIIERLKGSESILDKATMTLIEGSMELYLEQNTNVYPKVNGSVYCISVEELVNSGQLQAPIINASTGKEIPLNTILKTKINNQNININISETECTEFRVNPVYTDTTGAPNPELSAGMIPVVHNGTSWVKADITQKWYNYATKEWANAVLVTEATRTTYQNAVRGSVINDDDVLAYLVWIPRYRYKLFNAKALSTSPQTIEVKFEGKYATKSNGDNNGEWLTHPAFTFGNSEVSGIWVGKFETSGDATTPTIKPNNTYLGNQNVSTQFATAKKFNDTQVYGTSNDFDSHMMKNMEWGAVAYLSHSIYGKNGEVWKNNSGTLLTGCAGDSASEVVFAGCQNEYDSPLGVNASTTGNIYGIYDMSGGAWEYVMGGMYNIDNQTIEISLSGFDQTVIDSEGMEKYINKYTYGTTKNDQTAFNRRQLGDATGEVRGWYIDRDFFATTNYPWFIRGGCQNDTTDTGLFAFSSLDKATGNVSFRVVQLKP